MSLNKSLSARHLSMISIGGTIGMGLFVASGNAIYSAGPAGALLAYIAIGIMVYFLMTCLGEMSAYMPHTGSFCEYSTRFVNRPFGKTMTYNYYLNWAITVAAELSAASLLMKFWFPHSPTIIWSGIFFAIILVCNLLTVRIYGESEYIMSLVKVIAVIVFIILGALLITGVIGSHHAVGFKNWMINGSPFHGGFSALLATFIVAGFSFQGTEIIGVTAGETKEPQHAVPKATRQVFWRILLFYILTMAVISFLIPYTDPRLIHADATHLSQSPFTIVFTMAGLGNAASIMNLIILFAVLSAANSDLYTASRMMWYMADSGDMPKSLAKTNVHGAPYIAVIVTACFGALVFLSSLFGSGTVFFWLLNISSLSGFIAWIGIAWSHYKFRQQVEKKHLPYLSKFYPYAPLGCFWVCIVIVIGQAYVLFEQHSLTWKNLAATYITIPILLVIWLVFILKEKNA